MKKINLKNPKLIVALAAVIVLLSAVTVVAGKTGTAVIAKPLPSPMAFAGAPSLTIGAESALSEWVSADGTEKKVLFQKNPAEPLLIASLTKLMTAGIVAENYDPSSPVTISATAVNQGGRFAQGGIFTVQTLLSAMMVDSDNAAAYALSEKMGAGAFVALMNEKAATLGLSHTQYYNAVGFGKKNVSTAGDLVKLTAWLLENHPSIFPLSVAHEFDVKNASGTLAFKAVNTDKLVTDASLSWADRIVGNKTGNNKDAGQCLVLVVKAPNGNGYIVSVILKSKDRFGEMKELVDWDDTSYNWNF